jgi:hypothetical protein
MRSRVVWVLSWLGLAACSKPTAHTVVPVPHEPLEQTAILTDPPGVVIVVGAETLATRSPVVARYDHPRVLGVEMPLRIHALPAHPGECPQFVYVASLATSPDTVRFSMTHCPKSNQDFAGAFDLDSVEEPPERLRGGIPDAGFLLSSGKSGYVMVGIIIDTTGHPEPQSLTIVCTSDPGFNPSASKFVLGSVFTPARVYGRKVRVRVHMPVLFSLPRSGEVEPPGCSRN